MTKLMPVDEAADRQADRIRDNIQRIESASEEPVRPTDLTQLGRNANGEDAERGSLW